MIKVKFAPIQINKEFKVLEATPEVGSTMAPHYSDRDAVLLVESGQINFKLGDKIHILSAPNSISIPANESHSFEVVENSRCILILNAQAKIRFEK